MPLHALRPAGVPAPPTAPDDPRLGRWLAEQTAVRDATRVALVGFPSDAGVVRNGGRPGAALGPRALREALYRLAPDARDAGPFSALLDATVDLGDVPVSGDVEADQERLGGVVAALLDRGVFPVVLGGGHETAYGHALGYLTSGRAFDLLNWDAHADVRPLHDGLGHSGSPFRQALEHESGLARRYTAAGLHPWRVSADHATYVSRQGTAVWAAELDAAGVDALTASIGTPTLASFDLDAVDGAPGVSAPGVGGISPSLWLRAAEACGASRAVSSVDVVELSPPHDTDGRTATLAALTVWHVLCGIAGRNG
ncbi:MAG TPA: formimidoylglutamase [Rubricoccaceae bacterium]